MKIAAKCLGCEMNVTFTVENASNMIQIGEQTMLLCDGCELLFSSIYRSVLAMDKPAWQEFHAATERMDQEMSEAIAGIVKLSDQA